MPSLGPNIGSASGVAHAAARGAGGEHEVDVDRDASGFQENYNSRSRCFARYCLFLNIVYVFHYRTISKYCVTEDLINLSSNFNILRKFIG